MAGVIGGRQEALAPGVTLLSLRLLDRNLHIVRLGTLGGDWRWLRQYNAPPLLCPSLAVYFSHCTGQGYHRPWSFAVSLAFWW
jgi:hypothetical protein